jgi:branched-chain amino acid transport system permease protein
MNAWFTTNAPTIQSACVFALLGFSVQLAIRAGVLSFASVGFYAFGGYLSANLLKNEHWGLAAVLVICVVANAILAGLVSLILRRLKALYLAMATLALTLFAQALATFWDRFTGGADGLYLIPRVMPQSTMIAIVVVAAVLVAVSQMGRWGRTITSLRHDVLLSSAVGVRVERVQALSFVASGVVAGVAGAVQVSSIGVFGPTDIGFDTVVSALTVVILGGSLYALGPLVGAVVLAWLPLWLADAGDWRLIIQTAVLLVVVVWLPEGLVGSAHRIVSSAPRRRLPLLTRLKEA